MSLFDTRSSINGKYLIFDKQYLNGGSMKYLIPALRLPQKFRPLAT